MSSYARRTIVAGLFALGISAPALGQTCYEGDRERAQAFAEARRAYPKCEVGCTGCGCRGGPGYRLPENGRPDGGECVSYRDLVRKCGPPPHSGCVAECAQIDVRCSAPTEAQGCGSRGGPGWRGPDGECVSEARLAAVCGDPPDPMRCTPEKVNVGGR